MVEKLDADITVIGAGLVGSLFANFAADAGFKVIIIDKANHKDLIKNSFDGRASAISFGNKRILEVNNLWGEINKYVQPILEIRVSEEGSNSYLHFDHKEIGSDPLGYMVENRYLRKVFFESIIKKKNVQLFDEHEITDFSTLNGRGKCFLNNSKVIDSDLIVAADGIKSKIREKSNIEFIEKDYRQTAIVTTVKHEKHHNGIAHERFRTPGPFAILPLRGNMSSLVWVESNITAEKLLKLESNKFNFELEKRFGDFLGSIVSVPPNWKYKLKLSHAKQYYQHRIVLIGDAAHATHPLAGQNFNASIQDITSLVYMLKKKSILGLDIGIVDTLRKYDKLRRPSNDRLIAMTTFLNSLFSTNNSIKKFSRRTGIALVQNSGFAKNFFMNYAGNKDINIPNFSDININS
ncbi:MAG: 2-octaprenylphenol hydroxylase [Alphaproteobacteria bacterium MarineAlpha2_Bin1]|nr:MAG: 2-octaprenylphenol hydroxylase [Alphaproteobacteria bacterium MarineAlpha2_Bin1]|tara:strand:+ start:455 stop:1675 length:1221 start_codon:yes stop_codon:yes gene_type:complete